MRTLHKTSLNSRWADSLVCSTLFFVFCVFDPIDSRAAESTPDIAIQSSLDTSGSSEDWFTITGLPSRFLEVIRDVELSTTGWQQFFRVSVDQLDLALAIEQPATAGKYSVQEGSLHFAPRFPLSPGTSYRVTFKPAALPRPARYDRAPVSKVFSVARKTNVQSTSVTAIYPSTNNLPENLLKFYVHFSAPMSGDRVHRYIQLVNDETGPVELPFLELDDALWNYDMTQLTLFIDPGRIKREVKPLEDVGPSLLAGNSYQLVIDQNWQDANGNKLTGTMSKPFHVQQPDRSAPKIEQWEFTIPSGNTREPLTVSFGESMDYALAHRMIRVESKRGREIAGSVSLAANETEWRFVPDQPWNPGEHSLSVQTTIEDLAGNNIGKLFEVDLRRETGLRPLPKYARRSFEIR